MGGDKSALLIILAGGGISSPHLFGMTKRAPQDFRQIDARLA